MNIQKRVKYVLWGIAVIAAIWLIATPIYYYYKDFHGRPRSHNPAEWGTFGDYFGGTLNPIISLLTLIVTVLIAWELKKIEDKNSQEAIAASYQPHLVVEQFNFYAYPGKKFQSLKSGEFTLEKKWVGYDSEFALYLGISIVNIGLGAAKNVSFEFDFNIYEAMELIDDIGKSISEEKRVLFAYHKKVDKERNDYLTINYPDRMQSGSPTMFIAYDKNTRTHILSVSNSQNPQYLRLPNFFLELYTIYLYTWFEKQQMNLKEIRDFTPLTIIIRYNDIGTKSIESKYKIRLILEYGQMSEFYNLLQVEELSQVVKKVK